MIPRPSPDAEVLRWQSRLRLAFALGLGTVVVLLQHEGVLRGAPAGLAFGVVLYALAVGALATLASRAPALAPVAVAATVLADLGLIVGGTILTSHPAHYYRMLLIAFVVLHLTETHFGPRSAWLGLVGAVAGFLGADAAAIGAGAPLVWVDELCSAGLFAGAGTLVIAQYGSGRRRLEGIVTLFERAEEGDFSRAYDERADRRPDAVTLVGRAYNRVRAQLASMVLTDPLTSCLNRRGFDQALVREVARSSRAGSQFALLALDLDHFKLVNDTHGHPAGDAVLRETGALLLQAARAGDVVARVGGEEFSLLLPDTGASGAFQVATRLCDTMREHPFLVAGREIRLTVSVGVVSLGAERPEPGVDVTEQIKARADDALYAAKRSGRDRVRVWTTATNPRRSSELRNP